MESVPWAIQGGLEEAAIAESEGSAVRPDLVSMDGQYDGLRQPAGLVHLASSRMAFR